MRKIYVAGAITASSAVEVMKNIGKGIRVAKDLIRAGYAPFCPFLDFQYFIQLDEYGDITEETIKSVSIEWMLECEAIMLVPGWERSTGTRDELEVARRHEIPSFESIEDIYKHFSYP